MALKVESFLYRKECLSFSYLTTIVFIAQVFEKEDRWVEQHSAQIALEDSFSWETAEGFIKENAFRIADFDNHLDDVTKDWFNSKMVFA